MNNTRSFASATLAFACVTTLFFARGVDNVADRFARRFGKGHLQPLGCRASQEATSGFLCFSIVGGAAIPLLVGPVSGETSYTTAFEVPATCYVILFAFALAAGRIAAVRANDAAVATVH